jgi:anti-sigma B factor antagonist
MPDQPLHVEDIQSSSNGHRILRLTGPLTLSNLFEFQSLVRAGKATLTVVDLTDVPYIDSAGIGALLGAHVSTQREKRSLALVGVNQRVQNALEITKVYKFFSVFPTVAEAQSAAAKA